ncbi:MAG: biosynthetic arginine decarboxylase [Gammaproteobacteria bacterium]
MSQTPTIPQNYGLPGWSEDYFTIADDGHLHARPHRTNRQSIDLHALACEAAAKGLHWPLLVRFNDILHDRAASLCNAFKVAARAHDYEGDYRAIYPIKVNQQRSVVEELLRGGGDCIGLESGSKPELLAVLALAKPGSIVICNGYKDSEYIRLALIGRRLGLRTHIVIEKINELEMVLALSREMQVEPLLGVRVRLAASASGKWQNSGGEKSKFGLTAAQVLQLINRLKAEGALDWLQLLHSHIGSQIPNLRDIRTGITEAARYYSELCRLGAPLQIIDVGGGLGIDYEGTRSRHYCSINYTLEGYAGEIITTLKRQCDRLNLPHPLILSESGRAMTAHHAVLITNVIDQETIPTEPPETDIPHEILQQLHSQFEAALEVSPQEVDQETRYILDEARALFEQGELPLEVWAAADLWGNAISQRLLQRLRPERRRDRELLDRLREELADKLFLNFSLFQSVPDVWAIDQLFPIVPLQRLNERPQRSAILHDLTCDSDGCIDSYIDQDGVESTLPLHSLRPGEPYLVGIFLVGAYQEILGDMHNLFGDTNAVNVELTEDGYRLSEPEFGDTAEELLRYVHFNTDSMLAAYREHLDRAGLPDEISDDYYARLKAGLEGYTYFEEE